jgi:DNA-binding MarR family transcriptional regulator
LKNSFEENLVRADDLIKNQHDNLTTGTFLNLLSTVDTLLRYWDITLEDRQVSRSGLNILNIIIDCGGSSTSTEISKQNFRSKNAASRVISTLESHGFVVTSPSNVDRRSRDVKITPKGLALTLRKGIKAREQVGKEVLTIFTEDELKNLNKILLRLRKHTLNLLENKEPSENSEI